MIWNTTIYQNLTNCAAVCDENATSFSQASDADGWHRLIALSLDCADLCRQVGTLYVRGSENTRLIAQACVDVCQQCVAESARFNNGQCRRMTVLCGQTIDSCRRLINMDTVADSRAKNVRNQAPIFYAADRREALHP
jgi:hypothetical protein